VVIGLIALSFLMFNYTCDVNAGDKEVIVINDASNPVPVMLQNDSEQQKRPFQIFITITDENFNHLFSIPSGKLCIIEFISSELNDWSTNAMPRVYLYTDYSMMLLHYKKASLGYSGSNYINIFADKTLLFADETLNILSNDETGSGTILLTGWLVDEPSE